MPNAPGEHRPDPISAALLAAAAGGDQAAWREIVARCAPRVFGVLRGQCGDPELAEEIVQSAFCTVAAKIGSYVDDGRFEAWLFRIALNRLRDEERRRRRHAAPTEESVLATFAGPDRAGSGRGVASDAARSPGALERSEEFGALHCAIEQLSPADRRVVQLRHSGGLSFRQIADVLDEPLGTVLARHHRAIRKLRDLLERKP
ncbi:MAG TPA: sigma-70 family RNA polymerase sigma factor [Phycisphaerales bacterium]|nr:sigma-70 family RNA polymerase sigma factor [Phycisphaerales bacterium]HMP35956.1 sigma-70 family RNA polymerase sigma factor [Phycisphaerales bacterium]